MTGLISTASAYGNWLETDIAVWFYGEPGTGRMTGARYLHQLGRSAEGPFIRGELTLENAGQLNDLIARGARGTLVLEPY